jgi:hypothetical protein
MFNPIDWFCMRQNEPRIQATKCTIFLNFQLWRLLRDCFLFSLVSYTPLYVPIKLSEIKLPYFIFVYVTLEYSAPETRPWCSRVLLRVLSYVERVHSPWELLFIERQGSITNHMNETKREMAEKKNGVAVEWCAEFGGSKKNCSSSGNECSQAVPVRPSGRCTFKRDWNFRS